MNNTVVELPKSSEPLPQHKQGKVVVVKLNDLPAYYKANGLKPNGYQEQYELLLVKKGVSA